MATTISSTNGASFPLWQLPDLACPEPEDSVTFTTLDDAVSEGYASHSLFGLNTGVRSWKMSLPTLSGSSVMAAAVTDPYGATVSREQYIRNLFKFNKSTKCFGFIDPVTSQYYLVDFVDDSLTMTRQKGVNIRSIDFTLRQRRVNGITIFDPSRTATALGKSSFAWYDNTTLSGGTTWGDRNSAHSFSGSYTAITQNSLNAARFSSQSMTASPGFAINEVYIVMKMRESTFGSGEMVLGQGSGQKILLGTAGTANFSNSTLSGSRFYLNGVLSNAAPMNTWGVVNVRWPTGWGVDTLVVGAGAAVDVAEIILFGGLNPLRESREVTEYLATKWAVTLP